MHLGVKCSTLLSRMHTVSKQYEFSKLVASLSNGLAEIMLSPSYLSQICIGFSWDRNDFFHV